MADGLRLALGLLTILPVKPPARLRPAAAMGWAPLVGGLVGATAGLPLLLPRPPLLTAAVTVALLALLTRGMHLDGLADLCDGLGAKAGLADGLGAKAGLANGLGAKAERLEIMRRGDVGPFGVIAVVVALLLQASALATAPRPYAACVLAAATGRLAATWGCVAGRAARPEGLGALVAGRVPWPLATALTAALGAAAWQAHLLPAAIAGLAAAALLLRHAVSRLGGITGDVLGGLVEVAVTATLVTAALLQ